MWCDFCVHSSSIVKQFTIEVNDNTLILYYIECVYTCGPGEVANPACNGCSLIDICLRDKPCQNGGSCILLSPPDNYTCNCSGTGYMGTNCTGKLSILLHILFLFICY